MKFTSIAYGRTFNDGNFESTRIDVTADVGPTDNVDDAFIDLHKQIIALRDKQLDYIEPVRRRRP